MKYLAPKKVRTRIGNLRYLEQLRNLARRNRKNPTESEKVFWRLLSYKKLELKFVRQKPIGRFILDFYCSKLMLAIEIDGDSHDLKKYYDRERDLCLEQRGVITIRYKNNDVLNNTEIIKADLIKQILKRKVEVSPPFSREGAQRAGGFR